MTDRPKFTHGGARPGAGRKRKPPVLVVPTDVVLDEPDMLRFLQDVALGRIDANATQVRAAVAAIQYTHTKRADGGKREETQRRALAVVGAGSGWAGLLYEPPEVEPIRNRFAPGRPPIARKEDER